MQEEYALKHKICHMRQICVHTVHTENENIFEDKKRKFKFALAELFFSVPAFIKWFLAEEC